MIVRIATEGQYRVPSALLDDINEIDNRLVESVGKGDKPAFDKDLKQLLDLIRSQGTPLGNDELLESDLVIPPSDTTIEEARELFVGDGLIPG